MTSRTTFAAVALVAIALTAGTAQAASTRAEYVAQADPICLSVQGPVDASLARYIKAKRKHAPLGPAKARLLRSWSKLYGRVTTSLRKLTPAPGDEATIASWLKARGVVLKDLAAAGKAYAESEAKLAKRITLRGDAAIIRSNAAVSGFGFQNCASDGDTLWSF